MPLNPRFIFDPLRGTVPIGRVIWLYGILGSLVYEALGLLLDPGSRAQMWIYRVGGLAYSIYVTFATYRCAATIRSPFWRQLTRISAVLTLLLLPLAAYLDANGVLTLTNLAGIE